MMSQDTLTITLEPADDRAMRETVEFLAPRLRMLVEGEDTRLELRAVRSAPGQARFSLLEAGSILTERELVERENAYENVALWLAMKSAWSRSRAQPAPATSRLSVPAPPRRRTEASAQQSRRVTLAARGFFQGEGLSAYGAALGLGRGDERFAVVGDLGYVRSPVDDTLTVHHLFAEGHASYALSEGLALEGSARLTVIVADGATENEGAVDAGIGGGAQIWLNTIPRAWIRATVLGHPVQQRYLLDTGTRESSPVTLSVSAGVEL